MKIQSLRELKADLWVFDCDGTLYKNKKALEQKFINLMLNFIAQKYCCDIQEALSIRNRLMKKHKAPNTILALITEGYSEKEILAKTYFRLDLNKLGIYANSRMQNLFCEISGKKIILTNNHGEHARRVLKQLKIDQSIFAIYGAKELGFIQKPNPQAFGYVQKATGISKNIVFIDDELTNIIAARHFGWTTIWLNKNSDNHGGLWISEIC